jgi:hypothetical protein
MAGPLLSIKNYHVAGCGTPPDFGAMKNVYIGYFMDELGEQYVYLHKDETDEDLLYVGDISWESPLRVGDNGSVDGVNALAAVWVAACWTSATAERVSAFHANLRNRAAKQRA